MRYLVITDSLEQGVRIQVGGTPVGAVHHAFKLDRAGAKVEIKDTETDTIYSLWEFAVANDLSISEGPPAALASAGALAH